MYGAALMLKRLKGVLLVFCVMACVTSPVQAQACTREYMPVCGQVPGEAQAQTFPNQCLLKVANATQLSEGACVGEAMHLIGGDLDAHGCKPSAGYTWSEELASCVRPWLSQAITLEVAPQPGACRGVRDLQCLMAREVPEPRASIARPSRPPWAPLHAEIVGLNPVPGKRYLLRMRKDKPDTRSTGSSGVSYTLVRTLKESP